jgi:serine-type D-Ala-D-Ala carboxypeptidase/endopeptidase (penicillin-binding protein 4)
MAGTDKVADERAAFDCGEAALDNFLRDTVALRRILGLRSLSNDPLAHEQFDGREVTSVPRHPIAAVMLARLAVDRSPPSSSTNASASPRSPGTARGLLAAIVLSVAQSLFGVPQAAAQSTLPVEVELLLQRAKIPKDAVTMVVQDAGSGRSRLALNADQPMNPASLEKLLTTQAALDLLGPAFTWSTPVWLEGTLSRSEGLPSDGGQTLDGRVIFKGSGDPRLVAERLWLLMQRLRQTGLRTIRGDIVIDQSAFDIADVAPERFDNEPLRPYNVRPQPFVAVQKSLLLTFTPQPTRGVATVQVLPPLEGVQIDATVPLAALDASCSDWRSKLGAQWGSADASVVAAPNTTAAAANTTTAAPQITNATTHVTRLRFTGSFAAACGERTWPMAYPDPAGYHARALGAMWSMLGGTLTGTVRESRTGIAPNAATTPPSFEFASSPLAEVVRDINKYSNNTMAQQLFLTLSLQRQGKGSWEGSRQVLRQWLAEQVKVPARETKALVVDNGSGLSRESRLSAALLARVLQHAWRGPAMPDLMASLPASGLDGTMRRSQLAQGRAHLKTGSLRDVAGIAGYVLGTSGKRYVVVAIVNHEFANAARPALDALVNWVGDDYSF